MVSVTAVAFRKLPGDCVLFLNAATQYFSPFSITSFGASCPFKYAFHLLSGSNLGFSQRNPAMIFPLSPTNIIPSRSNGTPSSSSGVHGFIPPSYQYNSNGGSDSCFANLNRTIQL